MDVKKIVVLLAISICWLSCSDNHTEPGENENPNNATTIYDLFPDYHRYEAPYLKGRIILENISTKEKREFALDEKGRLIDIVIGSEWKIPDNSPYLFNTQFNAIRMLMPNEVCYKKALEMFPNYFYYECLYYIEKVFELENIETKELKGFNVYEAERMLRNPNPDWKIPQNAPYVLNVDSGLHFFGIPEMCSALSRQ